MLIFRNTSLTVTVVCAIFNRRIIRGEQYIVDKHDKSFKHNLIKAQLFAKHDVESKQIDLVHLMDCKGMKQFATKSTKLWKVIATADSSEFEKEIEVRGFC